jgi:hypothetical protein
MGTFQMGLSFFCSIYLGIWWTEKYTHGTTPYFTSLGYLICFVGLYNVIRQVNNINKIINEQINYVLKYCIPFNLTSFCTAMQQRFWDLNR